MGTMIEIKDLKDQEMFALPNGSVYIMQRRAADTSSHLAHVWCTHPPDAMTGEPPLIDFPAEQRVRHITVLEAREHYAHEGYVKGVFAREMDLRNQAAMIPAIERMQQATREQRQRDQASRPWWKKMFG